MGEMKAIQTEYKGYLFRSRLEARWAVFFDACGVEWEYEPEGIVLSDGTKYLPDFYLIDFHCYFEVKRKGIQYTDQGSEAEGKISDGMDCDRWAGIIVYGDPMDDTLIIFCQETDDGGGGSYENEVTIGIHPDTGKPHLFAYTDRRDRYFLTSFVEGGSVEIPMATHEYGRYCYKDFVTDKVVAARKLARQARFEHGETPEIRRECHA